MSSNPLNPPSFRFPFRLPDDLDPETKKAIEFTYNGLTVHEQAFTALKGQIAAAAKATQAAVAAAGGSISAGVTSFNTLAGNVTYFPFLGHVNNQLGNPAYATAPSDNGAKIIVGDSSAVAVTLTSAVGQPWFTIIDNDSSADATLTPDAGVLHGPNVIYGGGFGIVFYDGSDFWCGATPKVILGIDSTITTAALTMGGTQGSMTFSRGVLVSSVQST